MSEARFVDFQPTRNRKGKIPLIYLGFAFIFSLGSFLADGAIDFAIADSYWVVSSAYVLLGIALLHLVFWFAINFILKRNKTVSSVLIGFHSGLNMLLVLGDSYILRKSMRLGNVQIADLETLDELMRLNIQLSAFVLLFLLFQGVFAVYLTIRWLKTS